MQSNRGSGSHNNPGNVHRPAYSPLTEPPLPAATGDSHQRLPSRAGSQARNTAPPLLPRVNPVAPSTASDAAHQQSNVSQSPHTANGPGQQGHVQQWVHSVRAPTIISISDNGTSASVRARQPPAERETPDLITTGQATFVPPSRDLTAVFGPVANNTLRHDPRVVYSLDLAHLHDFNIRRPQLRYRGVVIGMVMIGRGNTTSVAVQVAAFWEAPNIVIRPAAVPPRNAEFVPTNFMVRHGLNIDYLTKIPNSEWQDINLEDWVHDLYREKRLGTMFALEEFIRVNRNGTRQLPTQPVWAEVRPFVYRAL